MAYVVAAYVVMTRRAMSTARTFPVGHGVVMAYVVMAHIVMACIVMA